MQSLRAKALLLFLALTIGNVLIDNGKPAHAQPAASSGVTHVVGTFFIDEFWSDQLLLDETRLGAIRIGIRPETFRRFSKSPEQFDSVDDPAGGYRKRKKDALMVTLSPVYAQGAVGTTPIPPTQTDLDTFIKFVETLAVRCGSGIEYWQLDNEVTNSEKLAT